MSLSDSEDVPLKIYQQMISACSGALVTSCLVTPFDVVKIRLQAQQKSFQPGEMFVRSYGIADSICECSHCLTNRVKTVHLNGTKDAFTKIFRTEGLTSLWSGLTPTLFMAVPATVIYFTIYDKLKYSLGYKEKDPTTKYAPIMAGISARAITTTLISPFELIRTKMQSERLSFNQVGAAVQITVKECGLPILMRGLGPSLLRDVPFSGIYWYFYESFKAIQMKQDGNLDGPPTFGQSFKAGALSGTIAGVVTLPFDVIKTHRQIELGKAHFCKDQSVTSTWSLIRTLSQERGVKGLFAGIIPRLIKIAPACAIMISTYEAGKAYFRDYNMKHRNMSHVTM